MTGDLISWLTSESFHDDVAMERARRDPHLPLQMLNMRDAVQAALSGDEYERQGMNLDVVVEMYRRRLDAEGFSSSWRDAKVDEGIASINRAQDTLESPIERAMLPWLVFGDYGLDAAPAAICLPHEDTPKTSGVFVAPQMSFGRYRLDFALVARSRSRSLIVAVECDGAVYHDRRSDLRRDAFLAGFRCPTVRASGSEIRTDPRPVIARIAELISSWSAMGRGQ